MLVSLLVILLAALAIAYIVPTVRGARRRVADLNPALEQLLRSDLANPIITVRPKFAPNKFVQFSRYDIDTKRRGVELVFPHAPWSEAYFPKVVTLASKLGIKYEIVDDDYPGLRFVFVMFGDSTADAVAFAERVMVDILGFSGTYKFRVRMD